MVRAGRKVSPKSDNNPNDWSGQAKLKDPVEYPLGPLPTRTKCMDYHAKVGPCTGIEGHRDAAMTLNEAFTKLWVCRQHCARRRRVQDVNASHTCDLSDLSRARSAFRRNAAGSRRLISRLNHHNYCASCTAASSSSRNASPSQQQW
jgi:hypothetical protein